MIKIGINGFGRIVLFTQKCFQCFSSRKRLKVVLSNLGLTYGLYVTL